MGHLEFIFQGIIDDFNVIFMLLEIVLSQSKDVVKSRVMIYKVIYRV